MYVFRGKVVKYEVFANSKICSIILVSQNVKMLAKILEKGTFRDITSLNIHTHMVLIVT